MQSKNLNLPFLFVSLISFLLITYTTITTTQFLTSQNSSSKTQQEFVNDLFASKKQDGVITLSPSQIKDKLQKNHRWFLLVNHFTCPDGAVFKEKVIDYALDKYPQIQFYSIDISDYSTPPLSEELEAVIGKKSIVSKNQIYYSPLIKGFSFKYTPSLLVIEQNKMVDLIEEFGGGEKWKTRYFRHLDDPDSNAKSAQNIQDDFNTLLKKWK